ncbi:MAG: hypothetical protein H6662_06265 [Ardenticatenaceae bacterium]|nr:hypothetical protein [Anaerolineales bacterium]MCB8921169.1 hypothetical protein [Ardenticatenaceae bacterium]MCB8990871.1 hypothetical protein [Ardenticatenaceae bacterium]MCB9004432.1 hypothetical protein [Ardenticatenaceae bacterium]
MKRILILLSLIIPAGLLVTMALVPALDVTLHYPLLHFYLVTFFTFAAAVVALFTAVALGTDSAPRHRLLATSFAIMGALFFIHGVTTPEALIFTTNPGIRWAAWLTLFVGGLVFALAAYDAPERPLPLHRLHTIHWGLGLFYLVFVLIVIFAPQWLSFIDAHADPWHQQAVFGMTLLLWVYAAWRLWQTWRKTNHPVDLIMTLQAAWFAMSAISMHQFPPWHFSWWLYHGLLLLGVITAVFALGRTYEQLRHFRLTTYYAAAGLIITAALALLASHLFSQAVERDLRDTLTEQALRVGQNLAISLAGDMPESASSDHLQQMAEEAMLFQSATWASRLAGLDIELVVVYDVNGTAVYPNILPSLPDTAVDKQTALSGTATTLFFSTEEPLFYETDAATYLQTFVPVRAQEQVIGVLSTLQDLPNLVPAVIRARLLGLIVASLTMGLLFLSMLVIVRRADLLITSRSDELAQAYANLQAAEMLRDDLTDMIVHDLRTPLTSVGLSLDLLERSVGDPSRAEFIEKFFSGARASLQQMLALINQILDVARLEAGQLQLHPEPFALADLLQEKQTLFALQAESANKQIRVEADSSLPPARADRELVSRVLENLIGNALKYTRNGGCITLRANQHNGTLQVDVADDGEGISPQAAARIFDKFYQVKDENGKPIRRGAGLGLNFCRLVLEAHNGRIWVDSQPEQGSTFSFTLPL